MTYEATVLARSPVFYLPMTETSGTVDTDVFADASGNGHLGYMQDGIIPGGADSFLSGEKAAAVDTTAGSGVIKPEDALGYASMPSLTMEVWMQVLSPSLADGVEYLDYWIKDADTGNTILFRIQGWATGQIELQLAAPVAGSSTTDEIVDAIPLAHSACWHHYVASFNSVSGDITFYIDGVAVGSINDPATIGQHVTAPHAAQVAAEFNAVINLNHVALYAVALTATQIAENYAAATPRQDAACFADWVRLSHVSGQGYWQSKGDVTEEWAGGVKQLALPLASLTTTPVTLVGQDPVSHLPAYCPMPTLNAPIDPVPVPPPPPLPGDACVRARCGAAVALQTKLVQDYGQWRQWINAAVNLAAAGLFAAVVDALLPILAAAEVAAWVLQVFKFVAPILSTTSLGLLPDFIPALSAPQIDGLVQRFFCQLQCASGAVSVSVSDLHAVSAGILADTATFPSDLQRELLGELVYYEPLQGWQAAMTNAGPSALCDGLTCP